MLRHADPADAAGLARLEADCFPKVDHFPLRTWRRLAGVETSLLLVIDDQADRSRLLAAICWLLRERTRVARMYSLAVHPDARGRGYAKQLIAASLARLPRHVDILSLEVRSHNPAAHALYRGLGFNDHAALPGYYADGSDGVRMRADRKAITDALAG